MSENKIEPLLGEIKRSQVFLDDYNIRQKEIETLINKIKKDINSLYFMTIFILLACITFVGTILFLN